MGTVSPLETVDASHSCLYIGWGPFNSILHKFDVYRPQALYQTLKGMWKMNKTSSLPQRRHSKGQEDKSSDTGKQLPEDASWLSHNQPETLGKLLNLSDPASSSA